MSDQTTFFPSTSVGGSLPQTPGYLDLEFGNDAHGTDHFNTFFPSNGSSERNSQASVNYPPSSPALSEPLLLAPKAKPTTHENIISRPSTLPAPHQRPSSSKSPPTTYEQVPDATPLVAECSPKGTPNKFMCRFCPKGFSQRTNLRVHERVHTGEKPLKCRFCGKGFAALASLTVHERSHTGEKPYACTKCDKCFKDASTRKRHMVVHLRAEGKEVPTFKCQFCGKSFNRRSNMQVHERIHTGEKPYQCKVCGQQFTARSGLSWHEKTHTGERNFICRYCGSAFKDSSTRKRHERVHQSEVSKGYESTQDVTSSAVIATAPPPPNYGIYQHQHLPSATFSEASGLPPAPVPVSFQPPPPTSITISTSKIVSSMNNIENSSQSSKQTANLNSSHAEGWQFWESSTSSMSDVRRPSHDDDDDDETGNHNASTASETELGGVQHSSSSASSHQSSASHIQYQSISPPTSTPALSSSSSSYQGSTSHISYPSISSSSSTPSSHQGSTSHISYPSISSSTSTSLSTSSSLSHQARAGHPPLRLHSTSMFPHHSSISLATLELMQQTARLISNSDRVDHSD